MTGKEIAVLLITIFIGLLLVASAIVLLLGRGASLIAGYNSLSAEEKEKFDEKKLCRFIGKIILIMGLLTPTIAIGGIYEITWLPAIFTIGVIALSIFALVYCNTGNRFRK